ncbi:MAG: GAF domain-containing protein [Dehalococcoidales bacterium]|nr:GAF domain-containing protein [Dehalococcoidales bacterium]
MNFYLSLPLIQAVLSFILIPVVLKGHSRRVAHRLFALYLLGIMLWGILIYLMRSSPTLEQAFFWDKWLAAIGPILAVIFYHFTARFTGITLKNWILPVLYIISFASLPFSLAGLMVEAVQVKSYGYAPVLGPVFPAVMGVSYIILMTALVYLYRAVKNALYTEDRNRYFYVLWGLVFSMIGGVFDFLPVIGLPLYPGAIIGNLIFCLITTIAIIKYHLLDIHLIFRKGITYLLVGLVVGLVYAAAMLVTKAWYGEPLPLGTHAIMLVVLVITLRILWDRIQRLVDRWFYQERYDFLNELDRFIQDTHDISNLEKLASSLVRLIESALQTSSVYLLMLSEFGDFRIVSSSGGIDTNLTLKSYSSLLRWIRTRKGLLYHQDIDIIPHLQSLSAKEKNEYEKMGVELFVPLKSKMDELIGLLLLGKKLSGRLYSEEDMKLVLHVADRVAIELENARLYYVETIIRSELQSQNERKTEFLHSVAHELKTPLTSLISSSVLLETEMDNITTDQEKRIIGNISRSAQIMNTRVDELLDFARSQIGHLELKLASARIDSVVMDAVERLSPAFEDKNQQMTLEISSELPLVSADIDKLEQVVMNLLSNANKYSSNNSEVIIRAKESDGNIIVEVTDSAQAVDADEREKIFEPYFRGKVGSDNGQLPGLGLGLAIAKQIIELHQGRIWVDNVPGKGNTFAFSLPALV